LASKYYFPSQIAKVSKYDQYIKEFLLKNSELSIEKIGTFVLANHAADEKMLHPQFITFQVNKKAQTSNALVDFVVAETGKSKTLVTSDLSSLFEEGRQFANLGKPFSLAGLGSVSMNNKTGEYEFTPGAGNVSTSDNVYTIKQSTDGAGKQQASRNVVIAIAFLIILLVAAGLGWGIYKYVNMNKSEPPATEAANSSDTGKVVTPHADTTPVAVQSPGAINATPADSVLYKFIFETTTSRFRAYKRYDTLKAWGEKPMMDSVQADTNVFYHLYLKVKITAKDTALVRDSLQRYFNRPIIVRPDAK